MTTLSIMMPDNLANKSQEVAKKLGISRTQFIRQAVAHELENLEAKFEQEAIIKSFIAMKNEKSYLEQAEEISQELNVDLPSDKDEWWSKQKS